VLPRGADAEDELGELGVAHRLDEAAPALVGRPGQGDARGPGGIVELGHAGDARIEAPAETGLDSRIELGTEGALAGVGRHEHELRLASTDRERGRHAETAEEQKPHQPCLRQQLQRQ